MRKLLLLSLGLLVSMSCGFKEDKYKKQVSKHFCKWHERCKSADFHANFDSVSDCADAQQAELDKLDEYYTRNCVYDAKTARSCVKALKTSCEKSADDFEALFQPCYEVWDCARDFEVGTDSQPLL